MNSILQSIQNLLGHNQVDYSSLQKSIINLLASVAEIDRLMQLILDNLARGLKIKNSAIVVLKNSVVSRVEFIGYPAQVPFSGSELSWLISQSGIIHIDQLKNSVERDFFLVKNLVLSIPLGPPADRIGYLLLGPKTDGSVYTSSDLTFFAELSPQMTISLRNAVSRREIQEFNATLAGKVAERTRELEQSQQAQLRLKDEFVFIATHDLATPVTAISGFSAMINASGEAMSETLKQNLRAISEASERLKVLVNDLLQVARSDAGTIKVEVKKINALPVIEAAIKQCSPMATDKNIQVIFNPGSSNDLLGDSAKLAEIMENLLSNAIKYNKPSGSVVVTTQEIEKTYTIIVKDTGLGIPIVEHPKVFTKFYRSEDPEVRSRPGTGLGLFVARMLTEKMGGRISFESKPGVGTTFFLNFSTSLDSAH